MTQRYAGMLRRQAGDWDKREMPVQAECCRQAARHMEERERELLAELATLRKEAERYRKWRAAYTNTDGRPHALDPMLAALADAWTPEQVDAAIDSASA